MLFFFGGGFHIGTPDIFKQVIEMLANQGFAALSADYRIHIYHDTTPEDSIRDGAACWKYVHENAEKWNIDPDKFVLSGGSAGAVIASLCEPMTGIMPAGLAFFYPGFLNKDMGPERLAGITGTEANGITVTNPGTVHPDLPPTLILHGEKDPIVPLENINQYTEALKENNVWCKYITFPDAGHGFMNYNKDRAYVYICVGELLLFMKKIETE